MLQSSEGEQGPGCYYTRLYSDGIIQEFSPVAQPSPGAQLSSLDFLFQQTTREKSEQVCVEDRVRYF